MTTSIRTHGGVTAYIPLEESEVKEGDDAVLISAAGGGLGNLAVQVVKARGAKSVGLTSKSKFEVVRSLGAGHVADSGDAGWARSLKEAVGDKGVQVYLDSIGDLSTEAFPLLSQSGQWIIFGVRSKMRNALPFEAMQVMIEKNITLLGFNLGAAFRRCRMHSRRSSSWLAKAQTRNHEIPPERSGQSSPTL